MTSFIVIMVAAVVVPIAVALFCRRWADRYRADKTATIKAVGREMGLAYRTLSPPITLMLQELPQFSLGRSHSIPYALVGERHGVAITVLELFSVAGASSGSRSNSGLYLLLRSPRLQSPTFTLEPSDMHLGRAIQFEDQAEFHRRFSLRGYQNNETAVRTFFTPTVRDFLLTQPGRLRIYGKGAYLLHSKGWSQFDRVATAPQLQTWIEEGLTLVEQFATASAVVSPLPSAPPRPATSNAPTPDPACSATPSERDHPSATAISTPQHQSPLPASPQAGIANLIVDLVAGGGTYQPNAKGMAASTYTFRQGQFIHDRPAEDPREAMMRGDIPSNTQKPCSRAEFCGIAQIYAERYFPVFAIASASAAAVTGAMAEQILAMIHDRGVCTLATEQYRIRIQPINNRYRYECHVPIHRYNESSIQRSFNQPDCLWWLQQHRQALFTDWLESHD